MSRLRRLIPDPFVLAVLLTLLTAALALAFGDFGESNRLVALLDAWRGPRGLWGFLPFAMQMCLILVTGYCLAESAPVRRLVGALAGAPRSGPQAAALVAFVACSAGVVNWGLGLIVGAILARDVGRSLHARGVRAHYPLLAAAGYMGLLVWHGGLSGSAPLKSSTLRELQDLFGAGNVARAGLDDGITLGETIGSPLNLAVTGALVAGVPLLLALLAPRRPDDVLPIDRFDVPEPEAAQAAAPEQGAPDRLYGSPIVAWLLGAPLLAAFLRSWIADGPGRFGPNEINAAMLGLGLLLHGSLRSYAGAAREGARACTGIILQFPLYAGIMGMLSASGLIHDFAAWLASAGTPATVPLLTLVSAAIVNFFVPSGGGQWGIQGLVALETAREAGIEPGRMVMAVAYGDELTNMLQPFWALPLLAITGCRARDIVGYTAIVMLAAGAWMSIGLLVF